LSEPARCPAVLVAAAASGQGKTTVAAALARLHARRGLRVRAFKCGPDFLDPHWLALATGAPVHSLDLWMTGEDDCARRLHEAAREADLIVVEGVMGLFDGPPSAADLARRFALPVLAVVDASAMAGTFGALAFGLRHYQPGLRWAGVLANRVGSSRHAQMLQEGLRDPSEWLGALPRSADIALPERHLGLVAAHELSDAQERLDAAADALAGTPLGGMADDALQGWAVDFAPPSAGAERRNVPPPGASTAPGARSSPFTKPGDAPLAGRTVAVARDHAFCFIYPANLDTLTALGARLAFFSPLADDRLPPCDAVWLPGGYPELHAPQLAACRALREDLSRHVAAGRPIWAECGGMMALFDQLVNADGQTHRLWGLLPGTATLQRRLAALGPRQLAVGGDWLRGHSFHYSTCETPLPVSARAVRPARTTTPADLPQTAAGDPAEGEPVYRLGPVQASYFHAWFASSPEATARLFLPESA
jgi:cobyrinic acid a,c-diamide synthase